MRSSLTRLALSLLSRLPPEAAHSLALAGLRAGLAGEHEGGHEPRLAVDVLGTRFPNPIGLAAGFDKDAVALSALMRLGFGAVEAGTVTRLPQAGNPRPRVFRLPEDGAVINRMGFNNQGIENFARRFAAAAHKVPLGANLGLNRMGADPLRDYPAVAEQVAERADWITVNVSSPNTPGLRDLQAPHRLAAILRAVRVRLPRHPPLLVKLAPDLAPGDLRAIVEACIDEGAAGMVVGNTTVSRPATLRNRYADQAGGLSGRPLMTPSTRMLADVARLSRCRVILVGVGGIASGEDVLAKLCAGASLVQLYTAFALHGPDLLPRLQRELLDALDRRGYSHATKAIGASL